MECQFCNKTLKTKSSLKAHQNTARYCLKLRGKSTKKSVKSETFSCLCGEIFTRKSSLNRHSLTCRAIVAVNDLQEKIKKLEQTLAIQASEIQTLRKDKKDLFKHSEEIAKQPRYTQNNKINITHNLAIFNKSDEDIQRIVHEKYKKEHLVDGQKGAARFTAANILKTNPGEKNIYAVTDRSRGNGKYLLGPGQDVTDHGMVGLSKKVFDPITKKACIIFAENFHNEEIKRGYADLVDEDRTKFRKEMVKECVQMESSTIEIIEISESSDPIFVIEED